MTGAPETLPPPTLTDPGSHPAASPPRAGPTTASTRTTAVLVGLLFLTATAAFITADTLNAGVLSRPDFPTGAAADTPALATGALLVLGQFGVVGIAVLLFPLLKRHGEALALAHVGFRVTELAAEPVLPGGPAADVTQGIGLIALVPGGVFELILPIWLLAKASRSPAATEDPEPSPAAASDGSHRPPDIHRHQARQPDHSHRRPTWRSPIR